MRNLELDKLKVLCYLAPMMKFIVEFTINNCDCMIEIEAADLETAKVAVNQWRVGKMRYSNNKVTITRISPKPPPQKV